jgi:hypothetical protein
MRVLLPVLGSLGIVAFAIVTPNKLFLIIASVFVAIALLTAVLSAWTQRRTGRMSARNQRRPYRAHLAEREERLGSLAARQRETDEWLYRDRAPRRCRRPSALPVGTPAARCGLPRLSGWPRDRAARMPASLKPKGLDHLR